MPKGPRRHKGGRRSLKRQRDQRPSFHIFCEGKNTEVAYFKSFPMNNMPYCKGDGKTKLRLVEEALKYRKKEGIKLKDPDQIWVVFDYDVDPLKADQKQDYNSAIQKANANVLNGLCLTTRLNYGISCILEIVITQNTEIGSLPN